MLILGDIEDEGEIGVMLSLIGKVPKLYKGAAGKFLNYTKEQQV